MRLTRWVTYNYDIQNETFKISVNEKKLNVVIPKNRYKFLHEQSNDDNIAYTVIKYDLIGGMRGQTWSVPPKVYQQLIDDYDVTIECFASPFNSQLVLLRPDAHYCSIFESDKIFKSYGSFFDVIKTDLLNDKNIVMNPPFIESMLKDAAIYAINHKRTVVFFGPLWKNAEFINILEKVNPYKQILKAGEHYYVDHAGKVINATFNSVVFILNATNPTNLRYK